MLDLLEILTFVWLAFWALHAFRWLAAGKRHSILFVILVHFVLSGVPLLLNVLFGKPNHLAMPGFYLATSDSMTSIIYCLYVGAVPIFWWWTGKGGRRPNVTSKGSDVSIDAVGLLQRLRPALYILLLSPFLAWVFAPNPQVYLIYGAAAKDLLQFEDVYYGPLAHRNIIYLSTQLSLVGAAGLLASRVRIRFSTCIFLFPWLVFAIWVSGTRHILFMMSMLLGYVFWAKGYLRGKRLVVAAVFAVSLLTIFSYIYQGAVRRIDLQSVGFEEFYEDMRINFGRDDVMKLAIFSELHPETIQILEHRGQSFLFYLTMYVPRDVWPEKPLPYEQYIISAAFMSPPRLSGFGITTSLLEETIANFSWFGMILGPLMISLVCRAGDACKNSFAGTFTTLVAVLFLAVSLNATKHLFFLWILIVIWTRRANNRNAKTERFTNRFLMYRQGHQ